METTKTKARPGLKIRWDSLKAENPRIRAREAAGQLGVSEAELLASACDGKQVRRLQGPWDTLIGRLETLGHVMALTRNESVVHEKKGTYRNISFNGHVGLVHDEQIDLRIFLAHWKFGFAATVENPRGTLYSLQFFDGSGDAVHKIYLMDNVRLSEYDTLVGQFLHPDQKPVLEADLRTEQKPELPDSSVDVSGFLEGWSNLKDTHAFYPLQKKYKVSRSQAFRLAESRFTQKVPNDSVRRILETAAAREVSIMVFVSSTGVVQIHSGPVRKVHVDGNWLNILDKDFNLHLREDRISRSWIVEKPTEDGIVTSLEIFDSEDKSIATFFGARKPGKPELDEWRDMIHELSEQPEA